MTGDEALKEISREAKNLARMLAKARQGKAPLRLAVRYVISQAATVSEYASELTKLVDNWNVTPAAPRKKKEPEVSNGETAPATQVSEGSSSVQTHRKRGQGT